MVPTELVRLFDSSTKLTIVYLLLVLSIITIILCSISFFISGILLQQPSTSGRRFCALFEYILHYPQGMTSQWLLDPFSSDSVVQQKWQCFGAIFEISLGHGKSRIYPNQKIFSQKYFKIKSRFVFLKKLIYLRVRCTLMKIATVSGLKNCGGCSSFALNKIRKIKSLNPRVIA